MRPEIRRIGAIDQSERALQNDQPIRALDLTSFREYPGLFAILFLNTEHVFCVPLPFGPP